MCVLYLCSAKPKGWNFYVGFTEDLKRRFYEHQLGGVFSTKGRRPFGLVYYEAYLMKEDALAREKYLKTSMGKRVLKKQLASFIKSIKSDKITFDSEKEVYSDGVKHNIMAR